MKYIIGKCEWMNIKREEYLEYGNNLYYSIFIKLLYYIDIFVIYMY